MRGKFPKTCKHFNSPKIDIKSSLGYSHITGALPMTLNCILKFLREARGKFPHGKFHRERRRKYPRRKFPFIPQGNQEEISAGMIPWNSPINPRVKSGGRGWLARWDFGVLLGLNSLLRGLYIFLSKPLDLTKTHECKSVISLLTFAGRFYWMQELCLKISMLLSIFA